MQDDEIAIGVMSLGEEKIESILSHWKQLTDQTFPKIMKDDLHLVTFFVMWSHPSTSLLHSIIKTSEKYPDQINTNYISTVNCLDWTDVCGMQNVSRYPTVHFYRKGQLSQYNGILDGKSVIASMKLLKLDSPLILNDKKSVEDFLNWRNPDLKDFVGTSVFGAFNKGTKGHKVFIDAATKQHGKILFGLVDGDSAKESCKKFGASFPCIVLLRKEDAVQPYVVYNGNLDADDIIKYITYEKVPLYSELNSKTFPLLYNRAQPLVVLFLDVNNHDAPVYSKAMTNVAASRKFNEYTFNWMNVHSVDSVGSTILEFYVKEPRIPTLILLDKKSESVYIYKQTTITEEGIYSWLTQLQMGKMEADVLLKKREFKPLHPGYDLKKLRNTEFETTSADQEDIDLLNEHGFGFDGDNQYHTNDKSSNLQDEDKISEDALIYDENEMEKSATDTKEEQRMTEEMNEDIEVLQKTGILKNKGKEKEPLKIIERGRTIKNKKQNSKDHQEL